jgi:cytochrome c oxidase cbb3-type subunit 1
MVMFGSIYYILPRILLKEWPSAKLISLHFWATALGVSFYVLVLSIGGVKQGIEMNSLPVGADGTPGAPVAFLDIVKNTIPWLKMRSYSGILITIGHLAFAINFVWMLLKARPAGATAPTLFRNGPEMEVAR